ncbi:phage integrase [Enterobacter asburiae]|uniref:phage integrase n=1 Tax=Enterobacter asburiae TaxID=61645 RepID=UPI0021D07219|nr:tyrosine-type recombinase/integrase [Enterobacter asburiae]MCU6243877.1 tyrosine-type recombinase/integrase [Enterobacter asburiae]
MAISKIDSGQYLVDVRPQGRGGRRIRKRFPTRSEAQQYERWLLSTQHDKGWLDKPPDKRLLSELIKIWWQQKGQIMKAGKSIHGKLLRIDRALQYPIACQLDKKMWATYRTSRLNAGIKVRTINREQGALSALFGALIETGNFHHQNPLSGMAKLRETSGEMGFLSKGEIVQLLELISGHERLAAKLCLATGARWGEVTKLRRAHLANDRVMFIDTKNGKNRTVPVSTVLMNELSEQGNGFLFADASYGILRAAIKSVAPELPDGQAVHVLRHTFASHFMMNGGNILTLQKILGHANIQQTMVYAHLAPDYLSDAVKFNPLDCD